MFQPISVHRVEIINGGKTVVVVKVVTCQNLFHTLFPSLLSTSEWFMLDQYTALRNYAV